MGGKKNFQSGVSGFPRLGPSEIPAQGLILLLRNPAAATL